MSIERRALHSKGDVATLPGMVRFLVPALVLALPLGAAEPLRIPIVMYPGQQTTHTTKQSLTAVTFEEPAQQSVAKVRFDQYQEEVVLKATKNGQAVIHCQTVDNRVSEILDVSVVPRAQFERYRGVSDRLIGVDGVGPIAVAGASVVVAGRVYTSADLETCRDLERSGGVVCAARLSAAISAIAPDVTVSPRASLDLSLGPSGWNVVIRLAEIPLAVVESPSRAALLEWSVPFVRNLNDLLRRWDPKRGYPPVISVGRKEKRVEITSIWNAGQGSRRTVLASIPSQRVAEAAASAGTTPDLLARWWGALLQDTLRMYLLGERPARSSTASRPSPLLRVYEHALALRGRGLEPASAAGNLSRAAFALALASGEDPLIATPLSVPADLRD